MRTTPEGLRQDDPAVKELTPEWLPETEEALQKLLSLPQNWNSYGARPIQPQNVNAATQLLRMIVRGDTPQPIVVPTVRGGVQLEWHICGIDLEIRSELPGQIHVYYEDAEKGVDWELDLDISDPSRIADLVAQLACRE